MFLSAVIVASVSITGPHIFLTQSGSVVDERIAEETGSGNVVEAPPSPALPSHTYFYPFTDDLPYCRGKVCQTEVRRRSVKRLKFRWSAAAYPPIHGGEPSTVDELLERYGTIPHRRIRRIRRDNVKAQTEDRDNRFFELRALQPTSPVPDTVSRGKKNCRSQNVCIDPVQERRERQAYERRIRWGKAKERASFFSGGRPRRLDEIGLRFGLKYLKRQRNVQPVAERGLPVPRKRNLRTY